MIHRRTLDSLKKRSQTAGNRRALVGFDGFVDRIVTAVDRRRGPGDDFDAIKTITEFSRRIQAAAGMSTNIELHAHLEKLGGNGPIMANALVSLGVSTTCIGALGDPQIHPVFAPLAHRARLHSLCNPAQTTAIEFQDGKIMLGLMGNLDEINVDRINQIIGAEKFRNEVASSDLVALLNWTMIPYMTLILRELVDRVLPRSPAIHRRFFFDLADPEKRSEEDLRGALTVISRFEPFGRVTLGLNLKEAERVHATLGGAPAPRESDASLRALAAEIRELLQIATVVVHPRHGAAAATASGAHWVHGPVADQPTVTTGGGDHFNAGFATGELLGLDPEECLTLGVATSGYYVRTSKSPTLDDLETFLANWH